MHWIFMLGVWYVISIRAMVPLLQYYSFKLKIMVMSIWILTLGISFGRWKTNQLPWLLRNESHVYIFHLKKNCHDDEHPDFDIGAPHSRWKANLFYFLRYKECKSWQGISYNLHFLSSVWPIVDVCLQKELEELGCA